MKEYYTILGLSRDCSESDIRKAYRRLAKQYHPDVNKSKNAHTKFIEVCEAYEYLVNHPQQFKEDYPTGSDNEQDISDFRTSVEYQQFREKVREKAEQQAKMRYDEFKKQHETFQKSGINDLALLFTIIVRIAIIPIFIFLVFLPVLVAIHNEWELIFLFLLTWPFAGIIAWYAYNNRKKFFMPGKLYYTPDRIKQIYTEVVLTGKTCYYCPSLKADSKPYRLDLLKLKEIKVKSEGFRQHNANYINEKASVLVPRSTKAFINHTICTLVKIISVISFLVFLDISSLVWRIILGMVTGGIISTLILIFSGTKSNVSYLFTYNTLIRLVIWIYLIALISQFTISQFDISTSDYIYFVITVIAILDSFLMQFINFVFGKNSLKPLIRQYEEAKQKFNEGYIVYNDVVIVSFVYPVFKWIFG